MKKLMPEEHRAGISIIVITKNEEQNIVECLESVHWSNEIIIVDAQSADKTVELAKKYTQHVHIKPWSGYADAKNFALQKVTNEWVLWLDADERVTPELADEIRNIIRDKANTYDVYEVARRAYFLGRWIKHCGWYPGYVTRLFRKNKVKFSSSRVHEKIEYTGTIGRLKNDLLHYTDDDLYHYFGKFNKYTSLAAHDVNEAGRKYSLSDLIFRPPFMFFKMFFIRLGFLDGMHGFILCLLSSAYVYTKYAKLWEIQKNQTGNAK
jgi:glycosyltransferase involved in cell wall biosynthesis